MNRKLIVGAAICAASVMGVSGSVFAGEVTGAGGTSGPNGNGTTGMRDNANSSCGFSGLEDGDNDTGTPGEVQNWGHTKKAFGLEGGANGPIDTPEGKNGCNARDFGRK
jgi:hypothetical protein